MNKLCLKLIMPVWVNEQAHVSHVKINVVVLGYLAIIQSAMKEIKLKCCYDVQFFHF